MDRGKPAQAARGTKAKITQHPPDLFALGSKPSSSRDGDVKRKGLSSHSSSSGGDRKRELPSTSSLTGASSVKKPKVSTTIRPPGSTSAIGVTSERSAAGPSVPLIEAWESRTLECEPCDLVVTVITAADNGETDRIVQYLTGAIKVLRAQKFKPDKILVLALLYLVKIRPSVFLNEHVVTGLCSLLKRDSAHSFKSKGNPSVPVLCAAMLMKSHFYIPSWPEMFVKLYVEDALGDRIWVDNEECKGFVDNVLTAFNTKVPPKSLIQPELSAVGPRSDTSSPVTVVPGGEADDSSEAPFASDILAALENRESVDVPVRPRYLQALEIVEQIVLEAIKEQLNRRQPPETITRNFLRLLSSACGLVEIRIIAVSRLEMWLHNPKLMRPAQELLAYICYNCTCVTQRDTEVTAQLVKIRLKTKALINVYLNCLRELISIHPENLPILLKNTIYNELSNARNPNNMPMLAVMFQSAPETAAGVLAEIFQDLLLNRDDYLRSLRALLREIVRFLRYDMNLFVLARSLLKERSDVINALKDFEFRDRVFLAMIDLLCMCMFLAVSPQVKEAAGLFSRGDKKEIATLQGFQNQVAKIQKEAVTWLYENCIPLFRPSVQDFVHALHKVLLLESAEQYYKVDMWPSENERGLILRLTSEVPLLQGTLLRIFLIGISKDHPLNSADSLELADQLIKRAANLTCEGLPTLQVDKLEVIDLIFRLCAYHYPENITLPAGYTPPQLAISNMYWKGWIMLLLLAAHNPSTFGSIAWKKYPTLRMFMEMCITNHFSFPPPTAAMGEIFEEMKTKELQVAALEKQQILEFESHLAAASTKVTITEQTSLLLSQLIEMSPYGDARQPPQVVLDQLQALNSSHRMGHLLCRSRRPDFLLDIIQRQGPSQHMPWLAELVHNSEGALSHLPVQCLCEYLLSSGLQSEKHKKHTQLLTHLQTLLTDPSQEASAACEVLEYFLRRLSSLHCASRVQAIKGLKLVLSTVHVDDEAMDVDSVLEPANDKETSDYWLLKQLPLLPHFAVIKPFMTLSLRQACLVETDPLHVSSYINFIAVHTVNDSVMEMTDLVVDLAQLIVERSTITAAILPVPEIESQTAANTLQSLMSIFCSYLMKSREPRVEPIWTEAQEQVLIKWADDSECTMHILVVHAMIILLTYGPENSPKLFNSLLDTWFPPNEDLPKAFLLDTSEQALLIPDWLKLRMIRSTVSRLVDVALINLEAPQLVLFIQSFGIPVSSMSKLLHMLDNAVTVDPISVGEAVLDKSYMAQLVEVQHRRGATGGDTFVHVLQLQEARLPDEDIIDLSVSVKKPSAPIWQKKEIGEAVFNSQGIFKVLEASLLNKDCIGDKQKDFAKLLKILTQETQKKETPKPAFTAVMKYILGNLSNSDFVQNLGFQMQNFVVLLRILFYNDSEKVQLLDVAQKLLKACDSKSSLRFILSKYIQSNTKSKELVKRGSQKALDIFQNTKLYFSKSAKVSEGNEVSEKELVDTMSKLLLNDQDTGKVNRTGLIVDSFAVIDPEIIKSCPELQIKLLFSKTDKNLAFRPYLLTLLTHRTSWSTLNGCVVYLLGSFNSDYDATVILDFLWALTSNPKLWQGRDKSIPKNYKNEDILNLNVEQLKNVVAYILEEACQLNKAASVKSIESRLPLLMQCMEDDKLIVPVVKYLIEISNREAQRGPVIINLDEGLDDAAVGIKEKTQIAQEFLLLLYMRIPKIMFHLSKTEKQKLLNVRYVTEWAPSVVDKVSHNLLTALSSTPRTKDWLRKSQEYEICARKLAAVHPILVLRQLPMMAASLKGRAHLSFSVFKGRNHLNLFVQLLGILELLQPLVYSKEYQAGLENTLEEYFTFFKHHGHIKESYPVLNRVVNILQSYISEDPSRALKFLQQHAHLLNELQMTHQNLRPLRMLMSSISLPKDDGLSEGNEIVGEVLVAIARPASPEPIPAQWSSLTANLRKIQGDDVYTSLQDIDHISNRRPAILETIVDQLCTLLLSPSSSIRQLSHTLLVRYLKHNPTAVSHSSQILLAVMKCFESENTEVVNTALEKLPEIVICMQEYAVQILQRVFELGVRSNTNATPNISKTIALLNLQAGC